MNAKIICEQVSMEKIEKAMVLGGYEKGAPDILCVKYKMYNRGKDVLIEFDKELDFCQLLFVVIDLLELSREDERNVRGYVDTLRSNRITEYLEDERVCLYLRKEWQLALKEEQDKYLDMLDIVTSTNKNYSIDIDTFFSCASEDRTSFDEADWKSLDFNFVKEGGYLYETENFEEEYLEDLDKFNSN